MPRYQKRAIIIEAIRCEQALYAFTKEWKSLPKWLAEHYEKGGVVVLPKGISLPTLEGEMLASLDDWIIRGVQGEIYPCKPEIFAATYDLVAGD